MVPQCGDLSRALNGSSREPKVESQKFFKMQKCALLGSIRMQVVVVFETIGARLV